MEDDIIIIDTRSSARRLTEILTWPVQVCPQCTREHAHPPQLAAAYWPDCWDCWLQGAVGAE